MSNDQRNGAPGPFAGRRAPSPPEASVALPAPEPRDLARSRPEQAATYIRRLIFQRTLRPGQKVPQDEIAAALGLSRIPICEALVALEKEGRVRLVHHRGAYVASVSEQSVQDIGEVATLVMGFTVSRAIERQTPEFVAEMSALRDAIVATEDPVELHSLFTAMQERVAEFAVGGRIARFLSDLRVLLPDMLFEQLPSLTPSVKATAVAAVDAITSRDGDAASSVFSEWHRVLRDAVLVAYRADGMFDP